MTERIKQRITGCAAALALTAGIALVGASPVNAATTKLCLSGWADAPARTYCPHASVADIPNSASFTDDECRVGANCSVTFSYGPGGTSSVTLTPAINVTVDLADVDEIDICIEESGSGSDTTYTATTRTSCNDNEQTAADAVGGGFSAN